MLKQRHYEELKFNCMFTNMIGRGFAKSRKNTAERYRSFQNLKEFDLHSKVCIAYFTPDPNEKCLEIFRQELSTLVNSGFRVKG